MPDSTLAGVITAIASVFTAVALVISALTVFIPILRQVRSVHRIVNQQRTDMERYQRALKAALTAAGIEIPVDQSIDPDELTSPRRPA